MFKGWYQVYQLKLLNGNEAMEELPRVFMLRRSFILQTSKLYLRSVSIWRCIQAILKVSLSYICRSFTSGQFHPIAVEALLKVSFNLEMYKLYLMSVSTWRCIQAILKVSFILQVQKLHLRLASSQKCISFIRICFNLQT